MSFQAISLQQLNENSLVDGGALAAAKQRWTNRAQDMRLQLSLDALFIIIFAQIQTQVDTFVKAIFDKIPTAKHAQELEVPIWSFHTQFGKEREEVGVESYVVTRDTEGGQNLYEPSRVITLLHDTDILIRLSAIFGSDFAVYYRPLLTDDNMYELVLRFLPDGRTEGDKKNLIKVWSKYGRLGIVDKLHYLPLDETYVLQRGANLGELTVRAPPTPSSSSSNKRPRSISSEESLLTNSSQEEAKHPHYNCYCQYSF